MAINAFKEVTPSAKMALINNALGNPALKRNQGSTFEIYDYIAVTPGVAQTINFFGNVNTKTFPFTNIQQNQLGVGESLSTQYIAFTRIVVDNATNSVTQIAPLIQNVPGCSLGIFSLLLDNSRIIKVNSLVRSSTNFNPKGKTSNNFLFYPDTDLTIPPQISFTLDFRIPTNTDVAVIGSTIFYGVHLFGTGAILNLKTNV
jgi:hypothetical protein